jgi:hypothetical protein
VEVLSVEVTWSNKRQRVGIPAKADSCAVNPGHSVTWRGKRACANLSHFAYDDKGPQGKHVWADL